MDKRITKRKIKRLPVTFSDGKSEHNGTSSDFSLSGLFIRTRKPFSPGTSLKMVLDVDNNSNIELTGIVARSIKTRVSDFKNGMGIKLIDIPQSYEDFLKELLLK